MNEPSEVGWAVLGGAALVLGVGFLYLELWRGIKRRQHSTLTESTHERIRGLPRFVRFLIAGAGIGFSLWAWLHLLFPEWGI